MKYTLLTTRAYADLNQKISEAMGFHDGLSTEIYTTDTPELDADMNCVMIITGEVQERFAELLSGIELVDGYEITPYIRMNCDEVCRNNFIENSGFQEP